MELEPNRTMLTSKHLHGIVEFSEVDTIVEQIVKK